MKPKRLTPRYFIIKMTKVKVKKRILKTAREKESHTNPIKLSADFFAETLQARRKWYEIFKVLRGKNLKFRIPYPERLSFRME